MVAFFSAARIVVQQLGYDRMSDKEVGPPSVAHSRHSLVVILIGRVGLVGNRSGPYPFFNSDGSLID